MDNIKTAKKLIVLAKEIIAESNMADKEGEYRSFFGTIKYGGSTGMVRNAFFTLKDGKILWEDGTWENGTWNGGEWKRGVWKNGTWNKGTWRGGEFLQGRWNSGTWLNGTWYRGIWAGGTWYRGIWAGGTWYGGYDSHGEWMNEIPTSENIRRKRMMNDIMSGRIPFY